MENSKLLIDLIKDGGPMGIFVAIAVAVFGLYLRATASSGKAKGPPRTAPEELSRIADKVSNIDSRLAEVEHDLENRPTRDEMHQLQLTMTRMGGKIDLLQSITTGTGAAVTRIEDHLLAIDTRTKGR